MPQRTINLYDGLEALYYLDSDYFNGTTNEISDQSGHGRHAEAQGGTTVGVAGPGEFEATHFDEDDDQIVSTLGLSSNSLTTFCLVKFDNVDSNGIDSVLRTINSSGNTRQQVRLNDGFVQMVENDNNIAHIFTDETVEEDKWYSFINRFDITNDDELVFEYRNSVGFEDKYVEPATLIGPQETFRVDMEMSGAVAATGVWTRNLNETEIEYLFNLTGPRRAQL